MNILCTQINNYFQSVNRDLTYFLLFDTFFKFYFRRKMLKVLEMPRKRYVVFSAHKIVLIFTRIYFISVIRIFILGKFVYVCVCVCGGGGRGNQQKSQEHQMWYWEEEIAMVKVTGKSGERMMGTVAVTAVATYLFNLTMIDFEVDLGWVYLGPLQILPEQWQYP